MFKVLSRRNPEDFLKRVLKEIFQRIFQYNARGTPEQVAKENSKFQKKSTDDLPR